MRRSSIPYEYWPDEAPRLTARQFLRDAAIGICGAVALAIFALAALPITDAVRAARLHDAAVVEASR